MLQVSPLPQWVKNRLTDMIDAYLTLIPVIEQRCAVVAAGARRDEQGELWDGIGTVDEYRLDSKYCAGQAVRLIALLRERFTEEQWELSPYSKVPKKPNELARWAWTNPWKHLKLRLVTAAMDEAPLEWRDFYLLYPERERQALVYTMGCGMSLQEAADKMGITLGAVKAILSRARARGRNARDARAGIKENDSYWARSGRLG